MANEENTPARESLPFEPKRKRPKKADKESTQGASAASGNPGSDRSRNRSSASRRDEASIPEVVGQRMMKRMLTFSGVPTFLGVSLFFVSYWLVVQDVVVLPNYAVLFTTLGCFGLGVVGLSYGALSASWDEDRLGSWLGFEEFQVNFRRLTAAWREARDSR